MSTAAHRWREWVQQHQHRLGERNAQRWIRGVLLSAAVLVLLVPIRPGGRPVIPLFDFSAPAPIRGQVPTVRAGSPAPVLQRQLDLAGEPASADARRLAQWVVDSADNGPLNFAILDKRSAKVFVFEPGGKLIGASPVLLGYAAGDDSVVGIGKRPIEEVRPFERTTPAGRFRAEPGRNAVPEDVLWVDYEAAVSMHRVRLTNPAEHRAERLKSNDARARRISYGCINMPPAFFEQVLWPNFKRRGGYVYVLPEVKTLDAVFPALASQQQQQQQQKKTRTTTI